MLITLDLMREHSENLNVVGNNDDDDQEKIMNIWTGRENNRIHGKDLTALIQ